MYSVFNYFMKHGSPWMYVSMLSDDGGQNYLASSRKIR